MAKEEIAYGRWAYTNGCDAVRLHDEAGFPIETSLELYSERRSPVALLGILSECVRRHWSLTRTRAVVQLWERLFVATPAERVALANWRDNPQYQSR